ncbi:TonB-dependent receptor [Dyadobacter aurulentus]|uniref:TonB-dependent receptor n=1 Tax=Dyadobacter sp. UC 10 TaxID=2605428 RepID=UPI001788CBBF|nr:TonB-dependent receptor [Dyadobacter sp. UC 10]
MQRKERLQHLLWTTMKLTYYQLLLLVAFMGVASAGTMKAQDVLSQTISVRIVDQKFRNALQLIEKNSNVKFIYSSRVINADRRVSLHLTNAPVADVLEKLLKPLQLTYEVSGRQIVLDKAEKNAEPGDDDQTYLDADLKISGTVTDPAGSALPGVSIVLKGTQRGTVSDVSGAYELEVPDQQATLIFSFVGYISQEEVVGGRRTIDISLKVNEKALEDVVVVGYGSQKRKDVIGSISTIKADVLETPSGSTNFSSLMQGQASGISVQSSSGRLGAPVNITIRGLSSISAGTSPLWIIDGVPILTDISIDNNGSAAQSPMSLINQSDIESIQVLKDAAATSIYGSRGSNGVIMVTTKSGATGKATVNLDYSTGISQLPFQRVKFLNTQQWFQMKDESKQAYGLGPFEMSDFYSGKPFATEFLTRQQAESINTDWRKEMTRTGSFHNANVSIMGGDKLTKYYVSGNYRKDKSVMTNEDLERFGVRANIDMKPLRMLDVGAKINLSMSKGNRGKNGTASEDGNKSGTNGGFSFVNTITVPFEPVYSVQNPAFYYNPYTGNPRASSDPANMVEQLDMYRVLTDVYAEYRFPFLEGLSARTQLSMDFVQANRNFWVSDAIRSNGSMAQDNASTSKNINYNIFLTYNKNFGDHSLNLVGGTEAQRSTTWYRSMEGQNLVGNYQQLGTPANLTTMFSGLNGERYLLAYFGRANYKFKDKYLAGISMRRDGSSVFTSDYRWGNFLAFSAGWILSDEAFMGDFGRNHFIKLRGSYGQTGNAGIPGYLDVSNYATNYSYGSSDVFATNGTVITSIGVKNLSWETTSNFDAGVDFGFFSNRINGSLAYYNKYVKDLLLASTLPPSSGIGSIWGNIGDLVNKGIELNVTSSNLKARDLKWQTTLNLAFNHNEVKKLTPQVDQAGTGMAVLPFISKVGYPVRDYYLADFAHVDPQTGISQLYALDKEHYTQTGETRRLKDAQGQDVLLISNSANANANMFHHKNKNGIPKYYGGITNRLGYKSFDFSFLVTFSGGNYIYDTFMRDIVVQNSNGEQLQEVYNNYWKKPGDVAKYQRLTWKGNVKMEDGSILGLGDPRIYTDQFLYKGDFVKLKSVSLGYSVPRRSEERKLFQNLRIYATLENLYTISQYPGWDPEGQSTVYQWDLPQLFSATVGASIKF